MNPMKPIYLDYMATTPIDPLVIEAMLLYMGPDAIFGNPASITHQYGKSAAKAVDEAREAIAASIGAKPSELIFTSGATEANNLAILGAAHFYQRKGRHLVTMTTEHKAVLDSFAELERQGFEVTYLPPQPDGLLDLASLNDALRADTILVSVMHVNNEIGVIQDIAKIGDLLKDKGIVFHVDAAQSAGKLAINLGDLAVDLLSLSAHKNYGPKGIGALYLRSKPRIRLMPLSFGGGQEAGYRSGTLPTHQIVGMGTAFALSDASRIEEQARISGLRDRLWLGIKDLKGIRLNGSLSHRVAGNINISLESIDDDDFFRMFTQVAVASSSACLAASSQPSYVLQALGISAALAYRSIRISLGRYTRVEDIDFTVALIKRVINKF